MGKPTWTKEQETLLRKQWPTIGNPRDLVPLIGKSYIAIKTRAKLLNLHRQVRKTNAGKSKATPEQDQYIKDNYLKLPLSQIARDIGYSETLVRGCYRYLGLVVPDDLLEQFRQSSRIKPGNVPANKGKKWEEFMSKEAMEASRKTQFKKGQIPQNKAHYRDGDISIRLHKKTNTYYKWIRVALRKWEMLHVYNWEQANGPVPEGSIVVFKNPADTMDCRVEKLECITMKENMLRNSASVHLTDGYVANCLAWRDKEAQKEILQNKSLIELKRQHLILNRTIHEQKSVS